MSDLSNGLTTGRRTNVEARQKQFERMYRESKVKRSPTVEQQRLNSAYKNSPANQANYTKPRGSTAVKAQSKARAVRQKYKGNFKRFGKQVKGAAQRGKVSAAKNISKFNGGLRAKYGGTISRVAPTAAALGVKTKTLGATISSSKFVAGAKGGPVGLLAVGAAIVWDNNIKAIRRLYDERLPQPTIIRPPQLLETAEPVESPFSGGQEPGVRYNTKAVYKFNPRFSPLAEGSETLGRISNIVGPVTGIKISTAGQYIFINVYTASRPEGYSQTVNLGSGARVSAENVKLEFSRADGLPNPLPPSTYESSTSNSYVNDAIDIDDPTKQTPPKLKLKVEKPKGKTKEEIEADPRLLPIPSVIPIPQIQPGDNTTVNPQTPFDSPRVVITNTPSDKTKQKKPRSVAKRTFYPDSLPYERPGTEIIRNNQTGVDTVIRRKYASDPKIPETATEVTTRLDTETDENGLPSIPPIYIPRLVERNPSANQLPKATKINPCKRGCSGASSGTSFAPGSDSATNLVGLINDQFVQNPLLKKIDATTTATKGVVTNKTFGLEAAYNFGKKAWEFTRADKIINGLTLFTSLHNAAMLGTNAAQSLGDTATAGLQLFNIKGFDGQPIDVNQAIGTQIKSLLTSVFGASNLNAASQNWKKLNRIFQSASAVVNSIQGTKNALLEADEVTGGNLAKLANTLLTEGHVQEDAYKLMNEQPDYQTQFAGILGKINAIDEIGDRVSSIVSSGLEIKENVNELKTNSDDLKKATDDFRAKKEVEENAKNVASNSPAIDRLDLLKKEPEE